MGAVMAKKKRRAPTLEEVAAERMAVATEDTEPTVLIEAPYEVRSGGHRPGRLDVVLYGEKQKTALRALFDGLDGRGRLEDGHIVKRPTDVIRWLLERVHDQLSEGGEI